MQAVSLYARIFEIPGTASFSAAAAIARLPISMIPLGTVLAINGIYGDWTSSGIVSALNVIGLAAGTPLFARLFDRYGQHTVGRVALVLSISSMLIFAVAVLLTVPLWLLFALAFLMGATQFSFGALVRTRWSSVLSRSGHSELLTTAYAFESAVDELIFIIGPIFATVLATSVHPVSQLFVPTIALCIGGFAFFRQTSTEPGVLRATSVQSDPLIPDRNADVGNDGQYAEAPLPGNGHGNERTVGSGQKQSLASLIRKILPVFPGVLAVLLSYMLLNLSFNGYDVSIVALTKEQGKASLVGIMVAVFASGSLVGGLVYGSRSWRRSLWTRYCILLFLLALGYLSFRLALSNLVILGLLQFVAGLFIAPTIATCNMIVQEGVPPQHLTEGLSWLGALGSLGASAGSALTGVVLDSYGPETGFTIPWVGTLLASAIVALQIVLSRRKSLRE
ncbi:MAG: MFS transporter [Bifidobacterium sp.]|jgi:MFS family permease|nr:MFS transporter [Bifidobacterium sp.]MCH4175185.1 MFS transporter [Bifidobacterium sp.]